jgi:hypothetical protein
MLPLVMEKEPRAQKCRPQVRLRNSGNSSVPDVMSVRRKSLSAICGGDFHQHMDMFSRQHAGDDLYAQVFALAAQAFGEP